MKATTIHTYTCLGCAWHHENTWDQVATPLALPYSHCARGGMRGGEEGIAVERERKERETGRTRGGVGVPHLHQRQCQPNRGARPSEVSRLGYSCSHVMREARSRNNPWR